MSMHEIEDLVANSIQALDRFSTEPDLRSLFARLYAFQERFDCSFTHFRVMDILLRHRFAYRFGLIEHPDYMQQREFFQGLREFTFLHASAEHGDESEDGSPVAGYAKPPRWYCDAGSSLWRRMVERGVLHGPDADPPAPRRLIEVVRDVARAAEAASNRRLIAEWYAMGPKQLLIDTFPRTVHKGESLGINPFTGEPMPAAEDVVATAELSVEHLEAQPEVADLREIVRRTRALEGIEPQRVSVHPDSPMSVFWNGLGDRPVS